MGPSPRTPLETSKAAIFQGPRGPAVASSSLSTCSTTARRAGDRADEGRAMLQIVHDLAPHASLAFATAFKGEESFAQNIERLARPVAAGGAGAKVIVDDVGYFEEPFFQDGPVAAAINKVTAEGVTYLTSAGNDNLFEGEGTKSLRGKRRNSATRKAVRKPSKTLQASTAAIAWTSIPGRERIGPLGSPSKPEKPSSSTCSGLNPGSASTPISTRSCSTRKGQVLAGSVEGNTGKNGTQRPVEIVEWENTDPRRP